MVFYAPHCHFRQLWTQKWKKSSWFSDHKALSRGLYCACAEKELSPPRATLGTRRRGKKRRMEEEEQDGMCGWTKWQDG